MAQEEKQVFNTGASRSKLNDVRLDLTSPIANLFKGQRYALGAVNHGPNNWRKGMPYSAIFNHMQRHLMLYIMGDRSDDHMAAVSWGADAIQEQDFTHPEMNDLHRFPPEVLEKLKHELLARWTREFPDTVVPLSSRPRNKRKRMGRKKR